jgi:hypothetical protein
VSHVAPWHAAHPLKREYAAKEHIHGGGLGELVYHPDAAILLIL